MIYNEAVTFSAQNDCQSPESTNGTMAASPETLVFLSLYTLQRRAGAVFMDYGALPVHLKLGTKNKAKDGLGNSADGRFRMKQPPLSSSKLLAATLPDSSTSQMALENHLAEIW